MPEKDNENITASELVHKSEKAIQNGHPRNSESALARADYFDQVPLDHFRNEWLDEQ